MYELPSSLLHESLLLDVIENLPAGVFAKDVNDNYTFVIWNRKMEDIFNNDRSDMLGKNDYDFFDKDEADYYRSIDRSVMEKDEVVIIDLESVTTSKGTILAHTIKAPVTLKDGRRILLGILSDITENEENKQKLKEYHDKLEHLVEEKTKQLQRLAETDLLTELGNRRHFYGMIQKIFKTQEAKTISLIYLDLDKFKYINDTFGHNVGDQILSVIGQRLLEIEDFFLEISRIGGDEFAILVEEKESTPSLDVLCEAIYNQITTPITIDEKIYTVDCSMGVSTLSHEDASMDSLLQNADLAMYHVKKNRSKQHWIRYDKTMHMEIKREFEIDQALRVALKTNEFRLVYQPQYDIKSKQLVGFEALIRWNSRTLGEVFPDEFIPFCEKNGYMHEISNFVFNQACHDIVDFSSQSIASVRFSLNISSLDLDYGLSKRLQDVLERYAIHPSRITIELTERNQLQLTEDILDSLKELRSLGLHISIDDFGTGYSSLSYLAELDVDEVKIDKSFIQKIEDPKKMAVIKAILALKDIYGFKVIAEGVETQDQFRMLYDLDFESAQGYYLNKPLEKEAILCGLYSSIVP